MNILYITTSYEKRADSATIRNNAWVNGLIRQGCNVTVLTVDWPENLKSQFLIKNNKAKVERTYIKGLNLLNVTTSSKSKRLPKWLTCLRHVVRDIIYFPDICRGWIRKISYDVSKFDVVISSSDLKSSHFVADKLLRQGKYHPYWIQIWGDPWFCDINLGFVHKLSSRCYEKKLIKRANTIVYVSELTRIQMQCYYPQFAGKMHYIPRGYYMKAKKQINNDCDIYRICYTGVLSSHRLKYIMPFLEVVNDYNNGSDKKVCISFYGDYDNEVINSISAFRCCVVHNSVDYECVMELYSISDALVFVPNGSNSTQIPGKIFDYMGTQLPIVCLMDSQSSPLATILSEYSRCKILKYDDYKGSMAMLQMLVKDRTVFDIDIDFAPEVTATKLLQIIR